MKRNQYHFLWLFSLMLLSDINCWTMVCSCIYDLDIWNWCLMGQAVFFGDVDLWFLHLHPRSWNNAFVKKSRRRTLFVSPGMTLLPAWSSHRKDLTGSWCWSAGWPSRACCCSCWSCSALAKLRGWGQRSPPVWMNAGLSASKIHIK